jgi:hypothetical protein
LVVCCPTPTKGAEHGQVETDAEAAEVEAPTPAQTDPDRQLAPVPGAKTHGSHQKEKGYVVTLRPLPNVDAVKALRWVLKSALRKHGLRCTDVQLAEDASHERCIHSLEEAS